MFALRPSRWGERALIGLDIGASALKAVVLKRRPGGRFRLHRAALEATPEEALTEGRLVDSLLISHHLRALWHDYRIRQAAVAVAAGGERVLCRIEEAPVEDQEPLAEFVRRQARALIGYSLDRAALDYEETSGAPPGRRRLVWVSCGKEQVEWLREAVLLSGKRPFIVDAEPCALANAYIYNQQPTADDVALLVHAGAGGVTLCLMRGEVPVFARGVRLSKPDSASHAGSAAVIEAVQKYWDEILERSQPQGAGRIFLSGGAARGPGLAEAMHNAFGREAAELDPFARVLYSPESESGRMVRENGPALAVAAGLALRGYRL